MVISVSRRTQNGVGLSQPSLVPKAAHVPKTGKERDEDQRDNEAHPNVSSPPSPSLALEPPTPGQSHTIARATERAVGRLARLPKETQAQLMPKAIEATILQEFNRLPLGQVQLLASRLNNADEAEQVIALRLGQALRARGLSGPNYSNANLRRYAAAAARGMEGSLYANLVAKPVKRALEHDILKGNIALRALNRPETLAQVWSAHETGHADRLPPAVRGFLDSLLQAPPMPFPEFAVRASQLSDAAQRTLEHYRHEVVTMRFDDPRLLRFAKEASDSEPRLAGTMFENTGLMAENVEPKTWLDTALLSFRDRRTAGKQLADAVQMGVDAVDFTFDSVDWFGHLPTPKPIDTGLKAVGVGLVGWRLLESVRDLRQAGFRDVDAVMRGQPNAGHYREEVAQVAYRTTRALGKLVVDARLDQAKDRAFGR